jgi:hypothetical protein
MNAQTQPVQVSLNIKRGLVSLVNGLMERLEQKGIPAPLAQGLGDVLRTGIQESTTLPTEEIKITDLARAAGLLQPERQRRGNRAV